jgi:hypothetical protein
MTRSKIRLIRFGSAKTLTQAGLPAGQPEGVDPTDCYPNGG